MQVFVSAWVGSENIGDELLFRCLSRRIQQLGGHVVVASKDPAATERLHEVRAVHHYDLRGIDRALRSSDALVFGGGGLIQDGTSVLSLPFHLSRVVLAKARGLPFIGLGLGAGPLRHYGSRWLLRSTLAGHHGLTVRDEPSAILLRQCGVEDVQVTSDMVFSLEPPGTPSQERIVLALRSYRDGLIPERYRLHPDDEKVEMAVARALDEVERRTRLHLRFLAFEGRRDEAFNRRIAGKMTSRNLSFASANTGNVMEEISRGRLTVAMRYHGGITAVVAERPVVLIGYAPKVTALAAELGDDCRYIEHTVEGLGELPNLVDALLSKTSTTLPEARSRLQQRESGNEALLTRFLGSSGVVLRRVAAGHETGARA